MTESTMPRTEGLPSEDSQLNTQVQNKELTNRDTRLVGLSTAGIRALMYQVTSFYLRTPAKLFRPTRVDYMAVTRLFVNGTMKPYGPSSRPYDFFKDSTLGVLITAVKKYGWRFIPERVLPPLIANSATGVVLYTTYLSSLQYFNDDKKNFLENPSPFDTFRAGFVGGAVQSLVAAPIDAVYSRSNANELLKGEHQNLWAFGVKKLKEIGLTGVFAGYSLSLVKESIGFGVYFCVFETIKNQCYHLTRNSIVNYKYYKQFLFDSEFNLSKDEYFKTVENERKYKALRTSFVFLGGITASFTLLAIQYPFNKVQNIHFSRLEAFDIFNPAKKSKWMTIYYNTYVDTIEHILFIQSKSKLSWFDWLYKGFGRRAFTTIPSTTLGLFTLEVLRQRLATSIIEPFED